MRPDTHYTRNGDVRIAYQVFGHGSEDIVLVPGWVSNVDLFWDEPIAVRFFEALGQFARVLLFDKRGTGLSDPIVGVATLEQRMDDVRAVMDAAGSKKATLLGYSEGGPMSILFAATHPDRTRALVLCGSYACRAAQPGYLIGLSPTGRTDLLREVDQNWGTPLDIDKRIPSLADSLRFRNWWAKFLRGGASPSTAIALQQMNLEIDVRPILPAIQVPSLIMHSQRDQIIDVAYGRYLAENIPDARLIEFDADDHVPFTETGDQVVEEIQQLLTGRHEAPACERMLSTIMFTDIVGSTDIAVRMGDQAWLDLLTAQQEATRQQLIINRGREVKSTGDGMLALFDGPARAIRCGQAIAAAVSRLGIEVRVGIHTGECIVTGDDVAGIAVHIAARIAGLAAGSQVLVSQTVRDLVAGSGTAFNDLGQHRLKGIEGEWTVCAAG